MPHNSAVPLVVVEADADDRKCQKFLKLKAYYLDLLSDWMDDMYGLNGWGGFTVDVQQGLPCHHEMKHSGKPSID